MEVLVRVASLLETHQQEMGFTVIGQSWCRSLFLCFVTPAASITNNLMPWYHCSNLHGLYPFHLELKYIYVILICWKKEEERKERREREKRSQVSNICFMKQNKITPNVYWTGSLWTPPWNHLVCRNGKAAGGSSFHGVLFENKEEISQVTDGFRHSSRSYCSQGTWKNWLELAGSQLSWEAKDLEGKKKDRVPKSTAQGHLLP